MLIARLGLATSVTVLFFWNNHGKMLCDGAFGAIQSRLRKRQIASPSDVMAAADEMKNNAQDGPRGDTGLVLLPHAFVNLQGWLAGQYYSSGVMSRRHNPHIFHHCSKPLTIFPERTMGICVGDGGDTIATNLRAELARWAHPGALGSPEQFEEERVSHYVAVRSSPWDGSPHNTCGRRQA